VTGKFPALRQLDGDIANPDDSNVFSYGLQVEDAGMSLQNVRERTTKIRKIGLVLRGLDIPDNEHAWLIEAIMRYLFSTPAQSPSEMQREVANRQIDRSIEGQLQTSLQRHDRSAQ